MPKINLF